MDNRYKFLGVKVFNASADFVLRESKRKIKKIIIHCSATPINRDFTALDIHKWHKQRGWSGIGYNFVVRRDGVVEYGRDVNYIPAGVKGFNKNTIHICYIGGYNPDHTIAYDKLTKEQYEALLEIVRIQLYVYDLKPNDVLGHNECGKYAGYRINKACPCMSMDRFREDLDKISYNSK